ncbi:MAG TPA: AI-2E family transporter [Abditibacteriaceae bacterium]|jgi:predicted PurR-regulated permease PerM
MNNKSLDWVVLRYVGYALIFLSGAYMIYLVRGALPVFMVGGLLAYALEPALQRLERRGYSRRAAVGFVFLVFILLMMCAVALLAAAWQQVQALSANADVYQLRATGYLEVLRTRLEHVRLPAGVKQSLQQVLDNPQAMLFPRVWDNVRGAPTIIVSSLGTIFVALVVLPIITLWLMMEMNPLRARVLMLVPPMYRRDVTEIGQSINEMLGRYVRGQMVVCGLFGLLCTIAFYVLQMMYGMGYALVLGLMAGIIYIVPYVGMATIATAAALTGYFTSSAPVPCAVIAVCCCVSFNLIVDYGVAPRVLGKGVGLHPLMVIFALLSGAQLGGIFGMILAIPLFASVRVVLIYLFPQLTAPIATTSPESEKETTAEATREVLKQTRDAEASTQKPVVSR